MATRRSGKRPRLRLAGVSLAVLAVVAGFGVWFTRHHRPGLRDGETYGIDVSHHQGRIDWEAVAADNIDFTYIKTTEAEHFLSTAPTNEADLPLVLDLGFAGQCPGIPDPAVMQAEIDDFVRLVDAATGEPTLLYLLSDFNDQFDLRDQQDGPFWERSIYRRPASDDWLIWQYSPAAAIDGIGGRTDLNVMRS